MTVTARKVFLGISWIPVVLAMSDVVHVSKVDGSSMRPTLNPSDLASRDWVLVRKYKPTSNLRVNDIVLLRSPFDPTSVLCKRVKAMPFDAVKYEDGMIIPRGHVWVEGDYIHSVDSRKFGPVSQGLILGKVESVIWPPQRWGTKLNQWVGNDVVTHTGSK